MAVSDLAVDASVFLPASALEKWGGVAGVKSPFTPHVLFIQDFQVIYSCLSLLYGLLHGSFVENVIFSIMQPSPESLLFYLLVHLLMCFWRQGLAVWPRLCWS